MTEAQPHSACPGCYALSKVLEDVTAKQYGIQYDLNMFCLRAPWVMEKDDFRYQLPFGQDVFGVPRWRYLGGADAVLHAIDRPAARGRPSTSAWRSPSTTATSAPTWQDPTAWLATVAVRTPYHSTWLDNAKAKFLLGWRPQCELRRMADEAWSYQRAPDDLRVIWYLGEPRPAKCSEAT